MWQQGNPPRAAASFSDVIYFPGAHLVAFPVLNQPAILMLSSSQTGIEKTSFFILNVVLTQIWPFVINQINSALCKSGDSSVIALLAVKNPSPNPFSCFAELTLVL